MSNYKISAKPTQQPGVIKFEANHFLSPYRSFRYQNKTESQESPLAEFLFDTKLVDLVYIADNYVAVKLKEPQKDPSASSEHLQNSLADFLNQGNPIFKEGANPKPKYIPIELYAQMTESPGILKFVCNRKLVLEDVEFNFNDENVTSPLAQALFEFDYVKRVKLSNNHILVTKGGKVIWDEVMIELRDFLRNYLMRLKPVL